MLVTYIDLDRLIDNTKLSAGEMFTIKKLMMGYTLLDLEQVYGKSRKTYEALLARACHKLKETNDRHWHRVYDYKPGLSP